jgi:hypothetical protein
VGQGYFPLSISSMDFHMSDNKELTFHPYAKGRITLGKLATGVSSFRGHREKDGSIVLRLFI